VRSTSLLRDRRSGRVAQQARKLRREAKQAADEWREAKQAADEWRKAKQAADEQEMQTRVRTWLACHPPRAELPVELGRWDHDSAYSDRYRVNFFGMKAVRDAEGERYVPSGPVVHVPILLRGFERDFVSASLYGEGGFRTIQMRPVAMRLRSDATEVRWYNWEPTEGTFGDADADLYRACGKAEAMIGMVLRYARESATIRGAFEQAMRDEGLYFLEELGDALKEWRGHTRTRYYLPGVKPGDPSEERIRK
jgi:hypothetical protein